MDRAAPPISRQQLRHARARKRIWLRALLVVVLVGVAIVLGTYAWVLNEAGGAGTPGPQVVVTITPGEATTTWVTDLHAHGVMGSPLAYRIWSIFHGIGGIAPGRYAFGTHSSFDEVQRVLVEGPNVQSITVPAGFTMAELSDRVDQISGLSGSAFAGEASSGRVHSPYQSSGSTSMEGLLGTGAYQILPGESEQTLMTAMVRRFDQTATQLDLDSGAQALGLTPYEAITVASIVEKEGVIPANMGKVARVILNRLHRKMPLQDDSTVLYALGQDGGPVSAADEKINSPYNTYLHTGLTPTPTCFPSVAALAATLHPPAGSWLYFVVVDANGTEAFSDTFAGQQANEALARERGVG